MSALPPPFLRLPQHLIDTILEALFELGPASIKPFALVARSFRRYTQLHLFKQIDFGLEYPSRDYPYRPRARELNAIIKCNPTIADYIQELKVVLSDEDAKWITQDGNLQQVMKAVKNSSCPLQKLSIRGYRGLPFSEVQVIETFFWRPYIAPNITTLDMRKIQNATPTLFSSCIMLRNLTLHDVRVTPDESKIEKPPSIQYLHYKFSSDAVRLLAGRTSFSASCKVALDISCIQSLTLVTSIPADFSYAQAMIDAAADSLEQLSLECGAHYLAVGKLPL
ncbi:hypothetical protein NLJ89_g10920 [Agrocybe chaxingu]|uniref:Uncharacterized protein n=1 Tax=Agrocybe chaxingu TaxID=84603 RepID=A0A9W8JX92_9AGAR|nr:hypothetical protein NLJ89_g10920 [Agrocybe chaxingu]